MGVKICTISPRYGCKTAAYIKLYGVWKGKFMKLEELLGEELYAQVKAKMDEINGKEPDKLKHVRYADLSEGEYVSKGKYDSLSSELTGKQSELDKANELISSLKKSEAKNEALKAKFADYEAQISQLQAQNKADKLNSAVKVALLSSGASDVDYITFKLNERLNKDGITLDLDENGNVKGLDSRISELKTAFPKMFESGNTPDGLKVLEKKLPEGDGDSLTRADVLKMPYQKRAELYNNSPEEFNKVMKG